MGNARITAGTTPSMMPVSDANLANEWWSGFFGAIDGIAPSALVRLIAEVRAAAEARGRAEGDAWKQAVIDSLVVNWGYRKEHEDDPRKAVADTIATEVQIALDPLVSKAAADLIQRGRETAEKEIVAYMRTQRWVGDPTLPVARQLAVEIEAGAHRSFGVNAEGLKGEGR